MGYVSVSVEEQRAVVRLERGKVNAINEALVDELRDSLEDLKKAAAVKVVTITGSGSFFSFGLDIPEFLEYPKKDFT